MLKFMLFSFLLVTANVAWGSDYGLNLEYADMKAGQFLDNRDPYVSDQYGIDAWSYRIEMNMRIGIGGLFYFEQRPHFEAINVTPKTVGWQYELGLHLTDQIDLFRDHHSRHVMEDYRPRANGHNPFPVEDLYGIRFVIVDAPGKHRSLGGILFGD